ncbi:N-acetyltransferase GCN5 [Rhodanobacter sp. 115]|nr:N-acetyltransferase GCN5 [Rhodanobacter sp. 115]
MSTQPLPFAFRIATAADIPALLALVQSAYRGDSGRRGWTTESDLLDGQRTGRRRHRRGDGASRQPDRDD